MSEAPSEGVRDQLEEQKLRVEIRKLRSEASWFNRLIPTVVPVAAAIIAGAQVWMAVQQAAEADRRTVYDQTIRHCELYLKMAESQLKLADFAIQQQEGFLQLEPEDQKARIHFLQALLSPREAEG
jgi:hypothetical protein